MGPRFASTSPTTGTADWSFIVTATTRSPVTYKEDAPIPFLAAFTDQGYAVAAVRLRDRRLGGSGSRG